MNTAIQCFNRMQSNKMVRILPERRKEIAKVMGYAPPLIGQWFYIQAVHCDDTLTLCSNNHFIMEGEPLDTVILN